MDQRLPGAGVLGGAGGVANHVEFLLGDGMF